MAEPVPYDSGESRPQADGGHAFQELPALQELAALLDLAHDAIIVRNAADRITFWSRGAQETYGWGREEALGQITHVLLRTRFPRPSAELRAEVMREGQWEGELTHTCKDGREVVVASRWAARGQGEGNEAVILEINRDITERKRAEEALRESERRFRTAFEDGAVGMALTAMDGRMLKVNSAFCRMLGFSEAELAGRSYTEITHPEDVAANLAGTEQLCSGQVSSFRLEKRYIRKDGTILWGDMSTAAVCDEHGVPRYCVTHIQDITERRRLEGELRENERKFRALFDNAKDAVFIHDLQGRFVDVNPEACERLGYSRNELLQMSVGDVDAPEYAAMVQARIQTVLREGHVLFESAHRRRDGSRVLVEINSSRLEVGGSTLVFSTCRDITGRKRAEEALRESEQRALLAVGTAALGTYERDLVTNEVTLNAVCREIFGTAEEHPRWDVARKAVHPDDVLRVLSVAARAFDPTLRETCAAEFRILRPDGSIRWVAGRGRVLFDESVEPPRPYRFIGVLNDITERKRGEEALGKALAEAERFRAAVEGVPVYVYMKDTQSRYLYGNRLTLQLFGCSAEELVGCDDSRFFPPETAKQLREIDLRVLAGQQTSEEIAVPDGGGGQRVYQEVKTPMYAEPERKTICGLLGVSSDVTARKQVEQVLARSKEELEQLVVERTIRLRETVAELEHFSYTITHDMRAPLRAMHGFAEIVLQGGERLSARQKDFIRRIAESAERMDSLITDALSYSKVVRQGYELKAVDAGALLRGILASYPEFQRPRAQVEVAGSIPLVMGNQAGLTQVFSNLLGNAVKFVRPGTVPWVRVWAELRKAEGGTGGEGARDVVRIWFEDKGIGIPKEHQEVVFSMFQQLDPSYEGTGIGLALVRKAVERMGGAAGVESEVGKGSRFWVELRRAEGEQAGVAG